MLNHRIFWENNENINSANFPFCPMTGVRWETLWGKTSTLFNQVDKCVPLRLPHLLQQMSAQPWQTPQMSQPSVESKYISTHNRCRHCHHPLLGVNYLPILFLFCTFWFDVFSAGFACQLSFSSSLLSFFPGFFIFSIIVCTLYSMG
ncbi:unnamed protein product [Plutella xylostella]|uniref:(diamondback moth) hypothetical protein n=1 Tax=Plutella xylostella TaxID=51655 RepID=A0A8S4FVE9_PLUXY|nr:unnamed protein product [Plutella xylostella]